MGYPRGYRGWTEGRKDRMSLHMQGYMRAFSKVCLISFTLQAIHCPASNKQGRREEEMVLTFSNEIQIQSDRSQLEKVRSLLLKNRQL
jgi:hypothetical protein